MGKSTLPTLPLDATVPEKALKPMKNSREHKVKGFADDLTVISKSKEMVIFSIDGKCEDMVCSFVQTKCYSLIYNVKGL